MSASHLAVIVREWYDPLYRFALSLSRDGEHALDLTQNAFHKLARHYDRLRDPAKVKSWLFSVVHREYLDHYRHQTRFPATTLDEAPELASERPHGGEARLDGQRMMRLLGELDEKFRAPLAMFYLENFSYKEIADTLDIPIGTVMSRLRRAKDQLRLRLESADAPGKTPIPFPHEARHG